MTAQHGQFIEKYMFRLPHLMFGLVETVSVEIHLLECCYLRLSFASDVRVEWQYICFR